ncbi:acetate kinase [Desulfovibrio sp. OttesenSCG-928-F20]|nr:acetate kinase [Desulfovibrio sp. OttesenSCG-928-F20]
MKILVINCGSSSFKYQLFAMESQSVLCSGLVERIGDAQGILTHKKAPGTEAEAKTREEHPFPNHTAGLERVLALLTGPETGVIADLSEIAACGHRVVQGGEEFTQSTLIDERVLGVIRDLSPLAPLHNPPSIQGIEGAMKTLPGCPNVAVFDTQFHATMPPRAYMYALPYEFYEKHRVRRYGFHGTSHRYVAQAAARHMSRQEYGFNVITCHLGNGCSIAAVKDGVCIDTSMGLTPLAGVMMGSRCGDIDPAIHNYLAKETGMDLAAIDNTLNRKSGLKGICGMNDMRDIHAAREKGDEKAKLAFEMFCYSIRKYIGAYHAALGRLDALVFTAGIGENDEAARIGICDGLDPMGIAIDPDRNARKQGEVRVISPQGAKVRVLVVPTNEELAIAQATELVLAGKTG